MMRCIFCTPSLLFIYVQDHIFPWGLAWRHEIRKHKNINYLENQDAFHRQVSHWSSLTSLAKDINSAICQRKCECQFIKMHVRMNPINSWSSSPKKHSRSYLCTIINKYKFKTVIDHQNIKKLITKWIIKMYFVIKNVIIKKLFCRNILKLYVFQSLIVRS